MSSKAVRYSFPNAWFLGVLLPLACVGWLPGVSQGQEGANSPPPMHTAGDPLVLPLHHSLGGMPEERFRREPFWMPLVHWKHRLFRHSDPNDPLRHMGLGVPLEGTSWRNRPFFLGGMIGGAWGDRLTAGIEQGDDLIGGYRLGYDFDHYWGSELRMAWNNFDLASDAAQLDPSGYLHYDLNLLYYPWGDSRWRPFAGLGLGGARITFTDAQQVSHKEHVATLPLQIGLKYQHCKWLALRFELTDNLALGNDDVQAMHNLSLTSGLEIHFGGWRRSYFPWSPKTAGW